jgi:hypothetical protein
MNGEIIKSVQIKVYSDIWLREGGRVVLANPAYGWIDKDLGGANHNVFRLNARNEVVWQVRRVEDGYVNWEARNRHAKEDDPSAEGYLDPFWTLGLDETAALDPQPQGIYRPGCAIYLTTRWWAYKLDPETGIATCTGEQIK